MRRIFLVLSVLVAFAIGLACSRKNVQVSIGSDASQQKTVSIVDHWLVPEPSAIVKDLVAVTFVVRNTAQRKVEVRVICNFADDGSLFGESLPRTVGAASDAKLMVRGFWRCPNGIRCQESLDCHVEPTR
jgi:hypothetical protein